jgi:uncharacterized protein (TIGR03086 family)
MLNESDPISLYRAATGHASDVVEAVRPDQLGSPTPCTEWTVRQLIDHLVGGTEYLLAARGESRSRATQVFDGRRLPRPRDGRA